MPERVVTDETAAGPGLFGKLPAHGDFVSRGLPHDLVERLHTLLRETMAAGKRRAGPGWLDAYLTAPIWRFAATGACLGRSAAVGLVMPSVDAVGRHFPALLLHRMAGDAGALTLLDAAHAWLSRAEALALDALETELTAAAVMSRLAELAPPMAYGPPAPGGMDDGPPWRVALDPVDAGPDARAYAGLGDCAMRRALGPYSVWTTAGSDRVPAELCVLAGLPEPACLAGFMAGPAATATPTAAPVPTGGVAP